MSNVLRFPKPARPISPAAPKPPPRGVVYVWPCGDGGGSWAVIHESESGDSSAQLSSWFSFEDATRAATRAAAEMNAQLLDGSDDPTPDNPAPPNGGHAA